MADKESQSRHVQAGYEAARENKIKSLQEQVAKQAERIRELEFDSVVPIRELQEENERLKTEIKELRLMCQPLWPV